MHASLQAQGAEAQTRNDKKFEELRESIVGLSL